MFVPLHSAPALLYSKFFKPPNPYKLNFFLQNGLAKIYKLRLQMKKNRQGYIESEIFGIEEYSVDKARVNNLYKLNFFSKMA